MTKSRLEVEIQAIGRLGGSRTSNKLVAAGDWADPGDARNKGIELESFDIDKQAEL